jgi:hypothetical protein
VGGDLTTELSSAVAVSSLSVGAEDTGSATGTAIVGGTLQVGNVGVGNGLLQAGAISTHRLGVGGRLGGSVLVGGDVTLPARFSTPGVVSVGNGAGQTGALHAGGWLRMENPGNTVVGSDANGTLEAEGMSGVQRLIVASSYFDDATGSVVVRSGGIQGPGGTGDTALWSVGTTSGDFGATGVADLTGDVDRFSALHVGRLDGGAGSADGTLILRQGTALGGAMEVGVSLGTGTAAGRLHLDGSLLALDDSILLGQGSRLEIDVQGLARGTLYGAIDATLATLDGVLELAFAGTPQVGVYDLVVSGSADGISGDFDSVVVTGVDPSLVSFGVELAPIEGQTVEVYRLHLIPEPGTGLLLGLGRGDRPGPERQGGAGRRLARRERGAMRELDRGGRGTPSRDRARRHRRRDGPEDACVVEGWNAA